MVFYHFRLINYVSFHLFTDCPASKTWSKCSSKQKRCPAKASKSNPEDNKEVCPINTAPICINAHDSKNCPNHCTPNCETDEKLCPGPIDSNGCPKTPPFCLKSINPLNGCPNFCPPQVCKSDEMYCSGLTNPADECLMPGFCGKKLDPKGCPNYCPADVICNSDEMSCVGFDLDENGCYLEPPKCFKTATGCPTTTTTITTTTTTTTTSTTTTTTTTTTNIDEGGACCNKIRIWLDDSINWNGDFAGDYNIGAEKDNDYNYWVKEDGKRAMWRNHNLKTWEIGDESDRSYGYGRGIELSGSGLESSKCAVQLYENSKGDSSSFIWKYTPEYGSKWVLMTAQNIKISCLEGLES